MDGCGREAAPVTTAAHRHVQRLVVLESVEAVHPRGGGMRHDRVGSGREQGRSHTSSPRVGHPGNTDHGGSPAFPFTSRQPTPDRTPPDTEIGELGQRCEAVLTGEEIDRLVHDLTVG